MKLYRTARSLKEAVNTFRHKRLTVGFVPTMGALHDGHLSLIRQARRENDRVVASIFVNPAQFGPKEDLARYPRPFLRDCRLLGTAKTDALFAPPIREIYPEGFQTCVSVGEIAKPLCGRTRPAHFSGVATVILKLLELVRPDRLYLGQKDYQQFLVVRRMVWDFGVPVDVRMTPIVRESDGLAMSSRNVFLTREERLEAPGIYRALCTVDRAAHEGRRGVAALRRALRTGLSGLKKGQVDYAEILDAETLSPVVKLTPGKAAVAACAVFYSKARLIDNILIKLKPV